MTFNICINLISLIYLLGSDLIKYCNSRHINKMKKNKIPQSIVVLQYCSIVVVQPRHKLSGDIQPVFLLG